jgi:hypothetical protein
LINKYKQVGQLVNDVGKLESQGSGKLHLRVMPNRENAYIITLRNEKSLAGFEKYIDDFKVEKQIEVETSPFVAEPYKTSLNIIEPIFMTFKVDSQPFNTSFKLNQPFFL